MIENILEYSQMDPEVLAAGREVRRIVRGIKWGMDPLMRNVLEVEGTDAIEREKLAILRSEARKAVQFLHNSQAPERSVN